MLRKEGMKILVIGANGQLGSDLMVSLPQAGHELTAATRQTLDVRDPSQIQRALDGSKPDLVINTAAFHNVELCEDQPEEAMLVNGTAVGNLARECSQRDIKLLHLSTDFVFDGAKRTPYTETDATNPLSAYAKSKLEGEKQLHAAGTQHTVIRTCGLFGHAGSKTREGNFIEKMIKRANAGDELRVVGDKIATPTSTIDLAKVLAQLIASNASGIYHVTNEGECSWHEFAQEALRLSGSSVLAKKVSSAEFKTKAVRPAYSVLSKTKLYALGVPRMPHWHEALERYMAKRSMVARPVQ
jgi:dTDP-4-dehydrorhamnose reductase